MPDDKLAAHLAGIRDRFEDGTLEHEPEACRADMGGETCTFHDAERMHAALEAVLALHQPGRFALLGALCSEHDVYRMFSLTSDEADRVAACADCSATVQRLCSCETAAIWPCAAYLTISRALLGEDGADGDGS